MSSTTAPPNYREITDANGRVYRVGETDRDVLGRSRASMVWLPWIAMMAVSVFEYGYGAAFTAWVADVRMPFWRQVFVSPSARVSRRVSRAPCASCARRVATSLDGPRM